MTATLLDADRFCTCQRHADDAPAPDCRAPGLHRAGGEASADSPAEPPVGDVPGEPAEPDSWAPVDLGPHVRGEVPRPEPTLGMARDDGLRMIYPGLEHTVIGEMESGKSWWCSASAAAEIMSDRAVVYVHFEESDPGDTVGRLQALGVPDDRILALFHFVSPERAADPGALAALVGRAPSLVIFDGVNEGMSLHRAEIRDEDGAATFRRRLVKPFTRAGIAVLSADHVVKDREKRDRYALGSVHKANALTGAQINLEGAEAFGRDRRGASHVFVTKDRPGHLRQHGEPTRDPGRQYLGTLVVDDTRERVSYLDTSFLAPKATARSAGESDSALVLTVIVGCEGRQVGSERALFAAVRAAGHEMGDARVRAALDDLLHAGRVEGATGPRGAKGYRAATAAQDHEQECGS